MRLAVGLLASVSLAGFAQASATESTPPTTAPQNQPPAGGSPAATATAMPSAAAAPSMAAPAASTPATSIALSATQPGAVSKPAELTALEKRLISQGYELEVHKDLKYFCRSEAPLGSRFEHKTCQTEDQILATTQISRDTTKQLQSPTGSFVTTPGR
jgi:hypothetical protein